MSAGGCTLGEAIIADAVQIIDAGPITAVVLSSYVPKLVMHVVASVVAEVGKQTRIQEGI